MTSQIENDLITVPDQLPPCDYRITAESQALYGCRHRSVRTPGHLVTAEICRTCSLRTVPCDDPRPVGDNQLPLQEPSLFTKGWNLATALATFISDGARLVDEDVYQQRLAICDVCEYRRGTSCALCGCGLKAKAKGRAFECPAEKWPSDKDGAH